MKPINAQDISGLRVASATPKKEKHIQLLEDKVDMLELEVKALKKQLVVKPIHKDYKELYEKLLPQLQDYWSTLHPF